MQLAISHLTITTRQPKNILDHEDEDEQPPQPLPAASDRPDLRSISKLCHSMTQSTLVIVLMARL